MLHSTRPPATATEEAQALRQREAASASASSTSATTTQTASEPATATNNNPSPSDASSSSFATDPSNPLSTRYFASCLKSISLYVAALERGRAREAARRDDDDDDSSDEDDDDDDDAIVEIGRGNRTTTIDGTTGDDDADDDAPPLSMPEDVVAAPAAVLDHSVLGELTSHIDELKDICGGPSAAFITLNEGEATSVGDSSSSATLGIGHIASLSSSSSPPRSGGAAQPSGNSPFRWGAAASRNGGGGGGGNVLTLASAAFSLEQQVLRDAYSCNGPTSSDDDDTCNEADEVGVPRGGVAKDKDGDEATLLAQLLDPSSTAEVRAALLRRLLTPVIVATIAELDPMATASSAANEQNANNSSKDEGGIAGRIEAILAALGPDSNNASDGAASALSVADICTLFDGAVGLRTLRGGPSSSSSSANSHSSSLADVLAFEALPPPTCPMESQLLKVVLSMCDFAATVAAHTVRFTLQFPPRPPQQQQREKGGVRGAAKAGGGGGGGHSPSHSASSSSHAIGGTTAASAPTSGGSNFNSNNNNGSSSSMHRFSSAIFEDSAAARAGLSDVTAQLMYHASSVLSDAMLVYKGGDSERDRIVEMGEFYLDRCESLLLAAEQTAAVRSSPSPAASPSATGGSGAGVRLPSVMLSFRQQCIVAARRALCRQRLISGDLYPFRRRIQSHLVGCSSSSSSSSSPHAPPLIAYLCLALGQVSRDTELTWFAEGFRTSHVQLLANCSHNNRLVARLVAAAQPYAVMFPKPSYPLPPPAAAATQPTVTSASAEGAAAMGQSAALEPSTPLASAASVPPVVCGEALLGVFAKQSVAHQLASAAAESEALPEATPLLSAVDGGSGGEAAAAADTEASGLVAASAFSPAPLVPADLNVSAPPSPLLPASASVASSSSAMPPTAASSSAAAATAAATAPDLFCSVLQSTGLDPENPAVGEWAEFCLRCMCTVSLAARTKLQTLKTLVAEESSKASVVAGGAQQQQKYSYHNTHAGSGGGGNGAAGAALPAAGATTNATIGVGAPAGAVNCYTSGPLPPTAGNGTFGSINGITTRLDTWEQYEERFM